MAQTERKGGETLKVLQKSFVLICTILLVTSDLLGTIDMIYNWHCSFLETLSLAKPFIYCPVEVVCLNQAYVEGVDGAEAAFI